MTLSMIWAQARGGVIGAGGGIPWHLPEDLALFKQLTTGSTVVMGRRTWDSLPERFRPLPGRRNVVLTRERTWRADGAEVVHDLDEIPVTHPDAWVIGGAEIYAALLPHAGRVVRTEVDLAVDGDTRAPVLRSGWSTSPEPPTGDWQVSRTGLRFRTTDLRRAAVVIQVTNMSRTRTRNIPEIEADGYIEFRCCPNPRAGSTGILPFVDRYGVSHAH